MSESGDQIRDCPQFEDSHSLKNKVLELERELCKNNEELQQFVYIISHDLRAPARHIRQFAELLVSELSDSDKEKYAEYINPITSASNHLEQILDDLLTLSRLGRKELIWKKHDLADMVNEISEELKIPIQESSAKIHFTNLPYVIVDKSTMLQLLRNLIHNGIKFRKKGESPFITIHVEEKNEEWIVHVKDNGIGIDSKHHESIFQCFKRLHPDREYPGSGVGLTFCKKIADRYRGKLSVQSKLGEGALFSFSFPKHKEN